MRGPPDKESLSVKKSVLCRSCGPRRLIKRAWNIQSVNNQYTIVFNIERISYHNRFTRKRLLIRKQCMHFDVDKFGESLKCPLKSRKRESRYINPTTIYMRSDMMDGRNPSATSTVAESLYPRVDGKTTQVTLYSANTNHHRF